MDTVHADAVFACLILIGCLLLCSLVAAGIRAYRDRRPSLVHLRQGGGTDREEEERAADERHRPNFFDPPSSPS